jgi:Uncharacterised protein family (UPF0167)
MAALLPGLQHCSLCGADGRCFDLQKALHPPTQAAAGCVSCLKAGRFGFFHVTAAGYLDVNGLTWYEEPEAQARVFAVDPAGGAAAVPVRRPAPLPPAIGDSAVEELRRTPDFPTWNEVAWPLHCHDFMVYLGTWQPREIRALAAAQGRPARDLLREMTDGTDEAVLPDGVKDWSITFHVFRCTGCATHRGILDLD